MEKWLVQAKKADFTGLGNRFGINPVIARIIRNRDIISEEEYGEYLKCEMDKLYSPLLMKDMEKAVHIIKKAMEDKKKIRVIGDYDIDGVTSGYILTDALEKLGADVDFDVPDRITDGYGINNRLIKQAYDDGVNLIVTCDNGIAASSQVEYAKELGMEIVVTDHHEVPYSIENGEKIHIIPKADAVVDHKRPDCEYPFKELCGAGVAYKLIDALYDMIGISDIKNGNETGNIEGSTESQKGKFMEKYLCFAAIGTVGDIVPLLGENRTIVKNGLKLIDNVENYGIKALIEANGLGGRKINSTHIGFVIGPCINAGGRLDTAKRAFSLFRSSTYEEAIEKAQELKGLNDERKYMTSQNTEKAIHLIENDESLQNDSVLIIYLSDCHESLAGIIAGRIKERYYKPTIVFTDSEDGVIKGSGRSVEGYSMFEKLTWADNYYRSMESNEENEALLLKFGGHKMAAGLSMKKDNLQQLREVLNHHDSINEEILVKKVWIDVAMPFEYITENLIRQLSILEPFGMANEKPVFAEKCTAVERLRIFGQNRNVVSLTIRNKANYKMEATYFTEGDKFVEEIRKHFGDEETDKLLNGKKNNIGMNILYYPEINEYNGQRNIKVVIKGYLWYNLH